MEPLILFASMVVWMVVPPLVLRAGRRNAEARVAGWRSLCRTLGLDELESRASLQQSYLRARSGSLEVHFEESRKKSGRGPGQGPGTRLVVKDLSPLDGLTLRAEGVGTTLQKKMGFREIEVGDGAFDALFFVDGDTPAAILAALDAGTRKALCALQGLADVEIRDGCVSAETSEGDGAVLNALPALLDVARRCEQERDVVESLAENVRTDDAPGVRLRCLLLLARHYAEHAAAHDALRSALGDSSLAVRLRAAIAVGAEGTAALEGIAAGMVEDGSSAEAVSALGIHLSLGRTQQLLAHALTHGKVKVATACVVRLGGIPEAGVESTLLPILAADGIPDEPLRVAAAEALGRAGTVAAVLPLKDVADRDARSGALRRAARQAIAEIQSRASGASPGQLSLAVRDAGRVSLVDTSDGAVSLASEAPLGSAKGT